MAFVYNNEYRMKNLVVTKTVSGSVVSGYPVTYVITDSFTSGSTYAALTEDEFAQLSDADYATRLSAFRTYVEGEESGLTLGTGSGTDETNDASGTDTVNCTAGTGSGGST